ncbi:MAG: zf-HC2 domain-containing protein [Chloroflexia bacterium]|nr:zf-HC2 domain-containing protein [Chloroflexia bacterium]
MISHGRAQELISARMDVPLSAAEQRELQTHLATCDACRVFVSSADDLARGLQVLPRLAPSPAVSRAVMAAVSAESSGWGWLRHGLQALSSPGMAVASGLALILALAGAMFVALNAPGDDAEIGTDPEESIAAVADAPLPTEVPTEIAAPQPTATSVPARTIDAAPTKTPTKTPVARPTATSVPVAAIVEPTAAPMVAEQIEPASVAQPLIEPVADESTMEAAPEETLTTDLAQTAAEPVSNTGEDVAYVEEAPVEAPVESAAAPAGETASEPVVAAETAPEGDQNGRRGDGGRKNNGDGSAPEDAAPAAASVATELPVPDEAIAALENAGASSGDLSLPPAPVLPMPPSQAFLPITPTPVSDGTPTPETVTEVEAPQIAEEWSGDLGVTALVPEAPDVTVVESEEITAGEKRDKSAKDGKSHENQQSAYGDDALGWSMTAVELPQDGVSAQTTDPAVATVTPVETADTTTTDATTEDAATLTEAEAAPQYDPVTGYEIDATTGLLIDPVTGYLLDLVNGLVFHPGTGYQVHPMTGLLIDPVTGAQLDPVTLAIVIPAGFGTDTPDYEPGSGVMRGQIETSVDAIYDNATYKVIPPTDGPVQPVGDITVPTESGDALEIIE